MSAWDALVKIRPATRASAATPMTERARSGFWRQSGRDRPKGRVLGMSREYSAVSRVALLTAWVESLDDAGIGISALNCSGNPLHPGESGRLHDAVTRKTIKLAGLMGVDRVVMMSGCPGAPGDSHPNWITTEWPPEVRDVLRWQWDSV